MRFRVQFLLAAFAAAVGCDDVVKVRNLAPEAAIVGLCAANDRLFIEVTVQDFEEDDVDLFLSANGKPVLVGPVGDGVLALRSERDFPGKYHCVEWAASHCEAGNRCPTALCLTEADGVVDPSRCVTRVEDAGSATLTLVATDGEDTSPAVAYGAQAGDPPVTGVPACRFSDAAHE